LDKAGFNRIYELTKGHPLALELIESVDDLKHPTKDIMKFVHEEIFSKLNQEEKELLKSMAIYRGPVQSDAIFLEGYMEYETLDKLIEKSLVTEVEPSIYELHDIIREFFYSRLTPDKRKRYHGKAAVYYSKKKDELAFIEASYHLLQSGKQKDAAKLIIDRAPVVIERGYHEEIMNILMSFNYSLDTKFLSQIYKLKGQILDIWGEWDNIFEYYYQCYTLSKYLDKYHPFNLERHKLHNTIGYMSWKSLEVDTAINNLESSLEVVKEVNDDIGENEIIRSLGWVSWLKGDYDKAITFYKQSLDGLDNLSIDTKEIKANILINLGNIYWEQGHWDVSIDHFKESLEIFKKLKNNYKLARIYNNIGCVHAEKGELSIALNFFNKGVKLSDEIYYVRGKAYTLLHQGEVQLRQKQLIEAQKTLENALEIFTKIEDHLGLIYCKINLGLINFFNQNWLKAKDFFQACADIMVDIDADFYLGEVYLGLSIIHSNLNNISLMKEFKKNAENTFKGIIKI
jgi:tetratricopeptide (TPR) repeat protein